MSDHRICVYTCITGKYDSLQTPVVSEGVDYIAYLDFAPSRLGVWKIMSMPSELNGLDNVKRQRVVKICPHRYLPAQYDISIWVDGNISVVGDMLKFVSEYDLSRSPIYTRIHPGRDCIYEEAKAVLGLGKDDPAVVKAQVSRYRREGYPAHIGMAETCVLLRRHNDMKCKLFDEAWAAELLLNSKRDQLSFNYVAWKMKLLPGYMTKQFDITSNEYFRWRKHG